MLRTNRAFKKLLKEFYLSLCLYWCDTEQWRTQEFFSGEGGVQQIQLRTKDREDGDQGAVAL